MLSLLVDIMIYSYSLHLLI